MIQRGHSLCLRKDRAVVFEYVEISKKIAGISSGSFVNAILRQAGRENEVTGNLLKEVGKGLDDLSELALRTSHPNWVLQSYYQYIHNHHNIIYVLEYSVFLILHHMDIS